MIYRLTDNFFELRFGVDDLSSQSAVVEICQIGMRHRVTADLKSGSTQLFELAWVHVPAASEKFYRSVKSGIASGLLQDWGRRGEVGFTSVVKRDGNASVSLIILLPERERFSYAHATPPSLLQPLHLEAEILLHYDVPHVTRFELTRRTSWNLQFVIHQEYDASL
jgi:hypothetical protein